MESDFLDFPQEVVGKVLDYVDSEDRQKFRLISKFWDQTVTNLYGTILTVHNVNLESSLACKASSVVGYFQSLTLPIPMSDTGTDFLSRLTSLTFTGVIVCYNIFPVFERCQNLKKLELIRCTVNEYMDEFQVNTEDPTKLLPALKSLKIKLSYIPCQSAEINFFKMLLPFFTSQESGKLDSIVLDNPNKAPGPMRAAFDKIFQKSSIKPRVDEHYYRHNRRRMNETEGENSDEFFIGLLEANVKTLKNLEMADRDYGCRIKMKICGENGVGDPTTLQFSEFQHSLYYCILRYETELYSDSLVSLYQLLLPQIHLTKLSVIVSPTLRMDQVYSICRKNAGALKSLFICPTERAERLDGFCLSPLQVLQDLNYSGPKLLNAKNAVITNIKDLPKSLKTFTTSGTIEFDREEDFNMAAFESLQNLDTLKLLGIPYFLFGEEKIIEMDSMKIRQLIAWLPSLNKLVLRSQPQIVPDEEEMILGIFPPNLLLHPLTLPDTSTDWIINEPGISFHKDTIIPFGSQILEEKPALIGRYVDLYSIHFLSTPQLQYPGLSNLFQGVIQIQPEFRETEILPQN